MRRVLFVFLRWLWRLARAILPRSLRRRIEASPAALGLRERIGPNKYEAELGFWRDQYERTGGELRDDAYYRALMVRIGGSLDYGGKIVVDIGCGPRGSLCWITDARLRIGVDPLADAYRSLGIARQPMRYVAALGEALPLADNSADIVVTINAMDHTDDPVSVMREMRRILRPGGVFFGSINLRRIPTGTEPSIVTREMVHEHLLAGWSVEYKHEFPECDVPDDAYRYADAPPPEGFKPEMWILWCRARKAGE